MSEHSAPRPDEQLATVASAQERSRRVASDAGRHNAAFTAVLGLLFGGLSLAVGLTEHATPAGLIASIIAFAVLLQVVMAWRDRTKKATGRGWTRRSAVALALTVALYAAGVFVAAFQIVGPLAAVWVPYGIVTALPMLAVAVADVRRP